MAPEPAADKQFKLPVQITGLIDVGRLLREVEALDELFRQNDLRHPGEAAKLPKTSQLLDQISELNKLNLLHKEHRQALMTFLKSLKAEAPVLHISFSADPAAGFLEKLMAWLRREINPYLLVTVGLEPNIGAGCVIRTPNRQFDLSLKDSFARSRDLLIQQLAELPGGTAPTPPAPSGKESLETLETEPTQEVAA